MNNPKLFRRIRPKKISDEIVEHVKELILSGQLKPGDRLPSERELAETMGVSRPVLREAISRLVAMGYLENIQGKGTFVLSLAGDYMEEGGLQDFVKKGVYVLPRVVEVRKILETWSAATAAERATHEEIAQMEEYLREMEEAKKRGEIGYVADANFHSAISYATHNPLLIHIMNSIYEMIERVTYEIRSRMYTDPTSHEDLFNQHMAIFEAIKGKDPDRAYKCMLEHMEYVEREVQKIVGEALKGDPILHP